MYPYKKFLWTIVLASVAILGISAGSAAAADPGGFVLPDGQRPDILLILTDDMRYDHMSNEGHPYLKTPHMDRLAREGIKYERAYVTSPLCGPCRGSMLTGLMPSAHKVLNHNILKKMEYPEGVFLPGLIHDAGYRTAKIGKWFQGSKKQRPEFDRWFVNYGVPTPRGVSREEQRAIYQAGVYVDMLYEVGHTRKQIKGHNTDILFDEACRFVSEPGDEPRMTWLSIFAPHWPYRPAERDNESFKGKGIPPRPNLELNKIAKGRQRTLPREYETQAEMIPAIDEGIGRLLQALEDSGRLDRTIIIFTSDNGFMWGEHGKATKRLSWEESVRVPLLIRYPKLIAPGQVNKKDLVSLADIGVTLVDAVGAKVPDGLYGRSLLPQWSKQAPPREDVLIQLYPLVKLGEPVVWASLITRDGWKIVAYVEDPDKIDLSKEGIWMTQPESGLFNLAKDPYELNNLNDDPAYADRRAALLGKLKAQMAANGAESDWIKP